MKRPTKVQLVLSITLLLLTACAPIVQQEPASPLLPLSTPQITILPTPSETVAPKLQSSELQAAFQAVLCGKSKFFNIGTAEDLDITQLNKTVTSDDLPVIAKQFSVVDLDQDGISEVILWLAMEGGGNDYVGFEILRYQDGDIYGYTMWYREFEDLCLDGSFIFAGGAAEFGVGTIAFTDDGYKVDRVTYRQASYDTEQNLSVSYVVNHEMATADEFDAAIDIRDKDEKASWYDLTDENIKTLVIA